MTRRIDLNDDKVVFRRINGRIVPVRVSARERLESGVKGSIVPGIAASVLSEGIGIGVGLVTKKFGSLGGALRAVSNIGTVARMGKIAGGTVAFSAAYDVLFGKRQKHLLETKQKEGKSRAKIWLASKPAFDVPHTMGEHSYLYVRDRRGKVTTFGGQIKNPMEYGSSGVRLVRNFPTDKISKASNTHDLTPQNPKSANKAVERIRREADMLGEQLAKGEYKYRSLPIKRNRYNSNSVVGTLIKRSSLDFKYSKRKHNMPGFTRTIPE